ncbi:6d4b2c5c-9e64-4983-8759-b689233cec6f [Thermothielavioides terrestris]|uniref:6d4b2c5c-9e64-4983-8759-b689233cec6f n=1 Tax=Thermothielavioides terrestris TaxID=2587410 RepID=A0A446BIH6_9PEZI|nr:6d4b2c5c-9e64-4983-8759-b689233cec6f [Thermothielavioides terrestris]
MKRKIEEEEIGPAGPSKRQQIETLDYPEPPLAPLVPLAPTSTESATNTPIPDDSTSVSSPTSTAHQPLTPTATSVPPSVSSRRSRKFPSDLKTIQCTYPGCPKTFNRPARLAAHLRSHTNDRPHRCPYADCDKTYLEEKHLTQHIKGSHTHEKRYVCAEAGCGKAFVTATRLRRHAAVHEGAERFRCRGYDGCSLSFRKHQTLQRHVRVAHLGLPAFVCGAEGCEAGFDAAGALRRHVEREHGELRFWCEECAGDGPDDDGGGRKVGFRTLLMLQAHMRKEHVNCVFCDVRCGSQADLERHVDMYHSGTTVEDRKTVECTWEGCGKKFTRVSNLNTHIRTAHEGRRFVCGQVDTFETEDIADWNWMEEGCGQAFISKLKLEEHVRYVHLGRKRPPRLVTVKSALPGEADEMSAAVPRRTIPCSVEGCPAKFMRHHDLEKHLQKHLQKARGEPQQGESPIDPRLQEGPAHGEQFFIESAVPAVDEPSFDSEWAEMRRLIDIDALVDAKGER